MSTLNLSQKAMELETLRKAIKELQDKEKAITTDFKATLATGKHEIEEGIMVSIIIAQRTDIDKVKLKEELKDRMAEFEKTSEYTMVKVLIKK